MEYFLSISTYIDNILGCHPPPQKIGWAKLQDPPQTGGMPKMKGGGAFIGEERYYKCMKGYVETGMIKIICLADQGVARWSIPDHSCTGKLIQKIR